MTAPKPPLAHFFFHSWGRWEDDKRIKKYLTRDVLGLPPIPSEAEKTVGEVQIQTRRCLTCNKLQTKEITIW